MAGSALVRVQRPRSVVQDGKVVLAPGAKMTVDELNDAIDSACDSDLSCEVEVAVVEEAGVRVVELIFGTSEDDEDESAE